VRNFLRPAGGATAIEYALIASIVSVVIVTTLAVIGGKLNTIFNSVHFGQF
jgi:pilus assembly protein Flp/PilA